MGSCCCRCLFSRSCSNVLAEYNPVRTEDDDYWGHDNRLIEEVPEFFSPTPLI